jgi:hypothetical protein
MQGFGCQVNWVFRRDAIQKICITEALWPIILIPSMTLDPISGRCAIHFFSDIAQTFFPGGCFTFDSLQAEGVMLEVYMCINQSWNNSSTLKIMESTRVCKLGCKGILVADSNDFPTIDYQG